MRLVGVGLVIGLTVALGLARLVESFLFGVTMWDPRVFTGMPAVLALLVVSLPAIHASRVDMERCGTSSTPSGPSRFRTAK